jgi:hypothetical protein
MVDWRALAVQLDAEVDATWGERIRVTPWKSGTFDAGVHDASRPIIDSVGELFFVAEQVGAGGGTNVTGFALRISEIDIRLSCASRHCGRPALGKVIISMHSIAATNLKSSRSRTTEQDEHRLSSCGKHEHEYVRAFVSRRLLR